ncbi:MAG: exopolyphosphatase/guanosine-5'-triphosphate,3'-diphosphate pyrophosphatase [Crocinitomicaceae bacterium]|jgi:exopolyphosphatase/guanosine-5'-triphosphate,3'-diphosphate pyrophosphatase
MRFAAIDIGTNAARLLVGEVSGENEFSHVRKLSYTRIPLRLGESVFEDGLISEKKQTDFLKTIQAFKLIADIFEVKELRACSTSAMRVASNGIEVKEMILKETDVNIEIITGEEEANLIFSTFFLMNIDKSVPFIVIDVGGGSTEINVFENGERVASKSFDIGTIRILQGKFEPGIWKEIHDWLSNHVDLTHVQQIYATGGNINKVHKLLGASYMEPISFERIDSLRNNLNEMTLNERIENYQLKPDRADVIVPALDIYIYFLKELDCSEIIVPKIGLSDGMIYTMHLKHS